MRAKSVASFFLRGQAGAEAFSSATKVCMQLQIETMSELTHPTRSRSLARCTCRRTWSDGGLGGARQTREVRSHVH